MSLFLKRRSIRKFLSQTIPQATVQQIIEAALAAPSAGNEQPWHLLLISDKSIMQQIMKVHPYALALQTAPMVILVCGDQQLERHEGFWSLDCSALSENILLSVASFDLGAVWLGVYPLQERVSGIQKIFSLPDTIIPFSLIPIGYPVEQRQPKEITDTERVYLNEWKNSYIKK